MNRPLSFVMVLLVVLSLVVPVSASPAAPPLPPKLPSSQLASIASDPAAIIPGQPLQIHIYGDGSVGLYENGVQQFYGGRASGVFLWADGHAWGPTVPAGYTLPNYTTVTPGALSGTGTQADPYRVISIFKVGSTGLELVQKVEYKTGARKLSFEWMIQNTSSAQNVSLFHAADLYVNGNDRGVGHFDSRNRGIGGFNQESRRYGVFTPATPAQRYEENRYGTIWGRISGMEGFKNQYYPNTYVDNGAGLQWNFHIARGEIKTIRDTFSLSPTQTSGNTGNESPPLSSQPMPSLQEFEFASQRVSPNGYTNENITVDLPITRYYGESEGRPVHLARNARLDISVFDVDSPTEIFTVRVNPADTSRRNNPNCTRQLTGVNNAWVIIPLYLDSTCFDFPNTP